MILFTHGFSWDFLALPSIRARCLLTRVIYPYDQSFIIAPDIKDTREVPRGPTELQKNLGVDNGSGGIKNTISFAKELTG